MNERTALINHLRALLLERRIVTPQGRRKLQATGSTRATMGATLFRSQVRISLVQYERKGAIRSACPKIDDMASATAANRDSLPYPRQFDPRSPLNPASIITVTQSDIMTQ